MPAAGASDFCQQRLITRRRQCCFIGYRIYAKSLEQAIAKLPRRMALRARIKSAARRITLGQIEAHGADEIKRIRHYRARQSNDAKFGQSALNAARITAPQ